jgi:hypothetical protein
MAEEVCLDRVGGRAQNPRLFEVARPEDKDGFKSMVR